MRCNLISYSYILEPDLRSEKPAEVQEILSLAQRRGLKLVCNGLVYQQGIKEVEVKNPRDPDLNAFKNLEIPADFGL